VPVTVDPYALTTLETAREHLKIPVSVVEYDEVIKRFINSATGRIESYCDRKFIKRQYTEYQDGFANNRLVLAQWPADKPTELWVDSTSEFTDPEKQLDASYYELDLSARGEGIGVALTRACPGRLFPRGTRNIKLVYEAGYADVDSLPYELQDVCLWIVEYLYDMRNDGRVGVAVKGKNQENTTFYAAFPDFIREVLDSYKRVEWPTGSRPVVTA
jgi:hypothetical protein